MSKTPTKKQATENKPLSALHVDGQDLAITNADKLYWPDEKITKGDLIRYYHSISKYILPYLKDRPQSLKRNPNGIRDKGFFHKHAGPDAPKWVETVTLEAESANRNIEYIVCNNTATLLYLNNLGCIEINPWHSRIAALDYPDYLVMDLDPADDAGFDQAIEAALAVKDVLDQAGAPGYCKTSGATGLHIYVPLRAQYPYEEVRMFAELIAILTEQRLPDTTTTERSLAKRKGRLYLDHQQNAKGQTLASVYSVRPRPGATVSTPLRWEEVKSGLHPSQFDIFNTEKRLRKMGDLFSGVRTGRINMKKCLQALGAWG